jgi:GTP 3',8-cyclase
VVGSEGKAPMIDRLARPLRDLRVSVTDRCNFRCPYCMPAEVFGERYQFLPKAELLTFEEIARLARVFADLGAAKLRITGGEPLVRADLEDLVALIANDGRYPDIAMTTNGYLLADKAEALRDAGLTRVTVSLDSLDDEVFGRMNGRGFTTRRVLEAIARAEEVGLAPIKINTVVQRGVNDHTIVDLARRFQGTGHIVRFIEYMDVGNRNRWRSDEVVPAGEIVERIGAEMPLEPIGANYEGEVAERYRYLDGSGEIGVIASVTKPFCGDCTRARLSTDGRLFTCLFASIGRDLRAPLRDGADDEELAAVIRGTWSRRSDRYSELRASVEESGNGSGRQKIEMYQIGG